MSQVKAHDPVEYPSHYTSTKIEPIEVIEAWQLDFCLGNVIKYIARAEHKGEKKQDLEKALWYLRRSLKQVVDELNR